MKIRSFIFIALIFIMTGCITVGDLPGQARVTVSPTSGADLNHAIFFPSSEKIKWGESRHGWRDNWNADVG